MLRSQRPGGLLDGAGGTHSSTVGKVACCASHVANAAAGGGPALLHGPMGAIALDDPNALQHSLAQVGPGDHLCLIYETREEQFAAAIPYIRMGLERGERCIYIADDNTAAEVLAEMRRSGIDVDAAVERGQLSVVAKRDAYLQGGRFDADWMVTFLSESTKQAEADGFSALRVTGEMTWALGAEPGVERFIEYEAKLNRFFPGSKASAICQYNAKRFRPEVILDVLRTHPKVVYGGLVCKNFYFVPPEEFLHDTNVGNEVHRLLTNILERNRAEEDLLRLKADLEDRVRERTSELAASNRELESFSYSVSHDLRAPLRGIDYFSQVLIEDYGSSLDSVGQDYLLRVRRECQRMTRLVNDMLTLSQASQAELRLEQVDVSTAAREVLTELARANPGRAVTADVQDGMLACGDPHLLRAVLENLIGNAWKYTGNREVATIEVGATTDGSITVFFVRDNGAGFDMAKADRLFGAFQRLHNASEFEGTGVGLATVKRIIQRHGGRIWAEGRVGEGATFYFALGPPAAPPAP